MNGSFPFLDLAQDIVTILGPPWQLRPDPHGQDDRRAYVVGTRGRAFWMGPEKPPSRPQGWRSGLMLQARGRYPQIPGHWSDPERPVVGFSSARDPDDIAQDLRRRFLHQHAAAHDRAVQALHDRTVANAQREALAQRLVGFAGDGYVQRVDDRRTKAHLRPGEHTNLDVLLGGNGETVDVQIWSLPTAALEWLLLYWSDPPPDQPTP